MINSIDEIKKIFEDRAPDTVGKHRFFSILIPLVMKDGNLHILYEIRSHNLISQPGEVCFPGGAIEKGESPREAAIRETIEEIGIKEEDIKIISQADTLYAHANFTMYSFLGIIEMENLKINEDEVDEVFLVPLDFFFENKPEIWDVGYKLLISDEFPYQKIKFAKGYNWRTGKSVIPIYHYEDRAIWGLTARITCNLIEVLEEKDEV